MSAPRLKNRLPERGRARPSSSPTRRFSGHRACGGALTPNLPDRAPDAWYGRTLPYHSLVAIHPSRAGARPKSATACGNVRIVGPATDTPSPRAFSFLRPLQPSPVFVGFWRYAAERQAILHRRLAGQKPPWTTDPVLAQHRFTNVFRVTDRVSQYLIREVIGPTSAADPVETTFRILLFKSFNRPGTWEILRRALDGAQPSWRGYRFDRYDAALTEAADAGTPLYNPAYVFPSHLARVFGVEHGRKHRGTLRLVERMMRDGLPSALNHAPSLQQVYQQLAGYPCVGPFTAMQHTVDLNYAAFMAFDEDDWIVAGPGARRGIAKCFQVRNDWTDEAIIRRVTEVQDECAEAAGITPVRLFGRRLKLIDVQNVFCEVDKYARHVYPQLGSGSPMRIKQRFGHRSVEPLTALVFPENWQLSGSLACLSQ